MSKFSTYDAAGPIDAAADIPMVGQGTAEKVLKLVSASNVVAAAPTARPSRAQTAGVMCPPSLSSACWRRPLNRVE